MSSGEWRSNAVLVVLS
jgi:hypothetical protein